MFSPDIESGALPISAISRAGRGGQDREGEKTLDGTMRHRRLTWSAVKDQVPPVDIDSDEGLEAILRRELIEIARLNGVSDLETLRDILLARLPVKEAR